ncbi:MAG: nucleotidyl transferase AbiEii/AbiGii toxin family protein [Burkholderiales bacterium]|nr:nucleotidyl transferase AbiEii/AbiGii toxin family protein [Burkholderiales bacterium]
MTSTSFDFSQESDLSVQAEVIDAVNAHADRFGFPTLIVGAFARDLHLLYRLGIDTQRKTEDVDIALAIPDWRVFDELQKSLIGAGFSAAPATAPYRLRHPNGLPVDLIPFGGIETEARRIEWPPDRTIVMETFGFRESVDDAHSVLLPGNVNARVVSLPGLALLKLICWQERHYLAPRKDGRDFDLIVRNYLDGDNRDRLLTRFVTWTEAADFDYETAGARLLGHDIGALLDAAGRARVKHLIDEQLSGATAGTLSNHMNPSPSDPARAQALLAALRRGLDASKDA